jgi:hypothetical protein
VNNAADELNNDASELINAASIPHTIRPLIPAGRSFATKVGKAASEFGRPLGSIGRKEPSFWCKAKAIIPGIRKRNTGRSLR